MVIFALFTVGPEAEFFVETLLMAFCSDILVLNKVCLTLTEAACLCGCSPSLWLSPSSAHTFFLPAVLLFFLL